MEVKLTSMAVSRKHVLTTGTGSYWSDSSLPSFATSASNITVSIPQIESAKTVHSTYIPWIRPGTGLQRVIVHERPKTVWQEWPITSTGSTYTRIFVPAQRLSGRDALKELRAKTRLTWTRLARLLGVDRSLLTLWAQGRQPRETDRERLELLVRILRSLNQRDISETSDPVRTTSLLLEALVTRSIDYPQLLLLCESKPSYSQQASTLLGVQQATRTAPELTSDVRSRRRGMSPLDRLGYLHDVDTPIGGRIVEATPIGVGME